MWSTGTFQGYSYEVKHYAEPSTLYGYKASRMSKIEIRKDNRVMFRYDRGLDIPAQDQGTEEVLEFLMEKFG